MHAEKVLADFLLADFLTFVCFNTNQTPLYQTFPRHEMSQSQTHADSHSHAAGGKHEAVPWSDAETALLISSVAGHVIHDAGGYKISWDKVVDAFEAAGGTPRSKAALASHFKSSSAPVAEMTSHAHCHWGLGEEAALLHGINLAHSPTTGKIDWRSVAGFMFSHGFDRSGTALRSHFNSLCEHAAPA